MPGLTHTAFPPTRSRRPSPRLTAPRRFILRACTSCIRSGSAPRGSFCSRPGHSRGAGLDNPVVMEVVNHYPVDGVQFDDYFTPRRRAPLNDARTFRRYGEGFASKADWRRHNTQQLIVQVSWRSSRLNLRSNLASARRGLAQSLLRPGRLGHARRRSL